MVEEKSGEQAKKKPAQIKRGVRCAGWVVVGVRSLEVGDRSRTLGRWEERPLKRSERGTVPHGTVTFQGQPNDSDAISSRGDGVRWAIFDEVKTHERGRVKKTMKCTGDAAWRVRVEIEKRKEEMEGTWERPL